MEAYSVKRSQVLGGPGWVDSERFDIVAKVAAGTTKEQVKVMLQNMLAERFGLVVHRETKESAIYALVVGAKGARLKEAQGTGGMKTASNGCPEMPQMMASGRVSTGTFLMMTPNGECMISKGETMGGLAGELSNRFDRPVVDQTGLKGTYDFTLRYDPSSVPGVAGRGGPKDALDAAPPPTVSLGGDGAPGIFDALQEQPGLRLEARKGPVELLAIDRVLKTPTRD